MIIIILYAKKNDCSIWKFRYRSENNFIGRIGPHQYFIYLPPFLNVTAIDHHEKIITIPTSITLDSLREDNVTLRRNNKILYNNVFIGYVIFMHFSDTSNKAHK